MATSQSQLDAAITALGTALTNEDSLLAQLVTAVNALIAKINAGTPPADLTTELTAINSMASTLGTEAGNIQTALATAKPITG